MRDFAWVRAQRLTPRRRRSITPAAGVTVADTVAGVVTRYLAAQRARDFDTLLTLFADDAVVIDEGQTRRGATEIQAWRDTVATSAYEYTTQLLGLKPASHGQYIARVRPEGNSPVGTVDLNYRFRVNGELIRRLEIA